MTAWTWSATDLLRLERFLGDLGLIRGPVRVRRIGDGHSNMTFLVTDGEGELVVRRPPLPPTPPGAHDVLREAILIAALYGTAVPVPTVLGTAPAGEVIDVPLYVMTYIAGHVVTTATPPPLANSADRARIGESLVDTLAALHALDWRAAGLERFGNPEGFNGRHFRRMRHLIADEQGRQPDAFRVIDEWLATNVPAETGAAIVHNDYRLGNVILAPDSPGRVAAVLDWELAAIGDPLWDVAYLLGSYPAPGEQPTATRRMATAVLEHGYPTQDELARRYAARTGADLTHLRWYLAAVQWKLAVLYEYGRRRTLAGRGESYYADPTHVDELLAAAHAAAGLPVPVEF